MDDACNAQDKPAEQKHKTHHHGTDEQDETLKQTCVISELSNLAAGR